MYGKTVIITGANKGIGKETAKKLAKKGARVILACRNIEAALIAKEEIVKESNNNNIVVQKVDLASLQSIRTFADNIKKSEDRLDVLLHNAGISIKDHLEVTEDDLELTMATNYFGPFLLTHLLIDLLKKTAPSRILVTASILYKPGTLNLDNINFKNFSFLKPVWTAYFDSKLADMLFVQELARRLEGTGLTANSFHPGIVSTDIFYTGGVPCICFWPWKLFITTISTTMEKGCQTGVFLASSEEVEGISGKFFKECKEQNVLMGAKNEERAKRLWEESKKIVKLSENDPKI